MEVLALILAGGKGSRLDLLSNRRSKPAMPFAGKFRIIDFCLSNLDHSKIHNVAILTQYQPLSLNEHIGSGKPWDFDRRDTSITLLQPHSFWYSGTADAVLKNIEFIERRNPKYVLILSGDHIYKMDYQKMLLEHKQNNASVTVACKDVDISEISRFGILETNSFNEITAFKEKPKTANSTLASMGIYLFNFDILRDALKNNTISDLDFGKHIIPALVENAKTKVFAHTFNGYWQDVGTYDSYLETNLDLAMGNLELDMHDPNWRIYTKSEDQPPVKVGKNAKIENSLLSNGCVVEGTVINSVLSPGVYIGKNSVVSNSVIMNDVIISEGVEIDRSIIDKKCIIGHNTKIGVGDDLTPNIEKPDMLFSGINVIERGTILPSDLIIERNCRILAESKFENKEKIKSGTTTNNK
ncbi:glucose-1-phosphate adenylyltransferase [Acholeplasma sp. OttesenSCG-928-E16]|nr:glucose-1-phosphate adenylyltransferase [Acholeplasma sp. OttesenSCG-928-E16]